MFLQYKNLKIIKMLTKHINIFLYVIKENIGDKFQVKNGFLYTRKPFCYNMNSLIPFLQFTVRTVPSVSAMISPSVYVA